MNNDQDSMTNEEGDTSAALAGIGNRAIKILQTLHHWSLDIQSVSAPFCTRTHALAWPPSTSFSGISPLRQTSWANSQRGAKAHPGIGFDMSGGNPGMV
jgi:hypothetical protein